MESRKKPVVIVLGAGNPWHDELAALLTRNGVEVVPREALRAQVALDLIDIASRPYADDMNHGGASPAQPRYRVNFRTGKPLRY